jgi:hypothetical protein
MVEDETPATWQSLEIWSKRLSTLTTIGLSLVGGGTLLIVIALLAKDITRRTIEITPISVPQTLINNGYTSDAVTQRLQLALNKIIQPSHFLQLDRTTGFKKNVDLVPVVQGQTQVCHWTPYALPFVLSSPTTGRCLVR